MVFIHGIHCLGAAPEGGRGETVSRWTEPSLARCVGLGIVFPVAMTEDRS